tara:strand:- start:311 stop:493 length:183 start_codon:yes stop_codon:yes gene_type:complete
MDQSTVIIGKVIRKDTLINLQIEKSELERLLNEVKVRERIILKERGLQSWLDWIMEQLGY